MTADLRDRIESCGMGAEASMRMEARCLERGDFLGAAAWADQAAYWSAEAFRAAVQV